MTHTYKHIVVVHGIGDQEPNETVLGFMNKLARHMAKESGLEVDVQNLISNVDGITRAPTPGRARPLSKHPSFLTCIDTTTGTKHVIGFSEVYWQPIVNQHLKNNNEKPPVPIPTWAHSVGTRLLGPSEDLETWRDVIDNLESLLKDIRALANVLNRAGKLAKILDRFLGDVQLYADSDEVRLEINGLFLDTLAQVRTLANDALLRLQRDDPAAGPFVDIEIYVVAHSEGTVVSFNSLVQAAILTEGAALHPSEPDFGSLFPQEATRAAQPGREGVGRWLPRVRGLVTMGSPLDKHFLIWKNHFRKHYLRNAQVTGDRNPVCIPWYNYWERSDPVGYGVKSLFEAAQGVTSPTDAAKLFNRKHDTGFTRYPIPGKAHVDYWEDPAIYQDFLWRVMGFQPTKQCPIKDKWWKRLQAPGDWIAFWVALALKTGFALFFLYRLVEGLMLNAGIQASRLGLDKVSHWLARFVDLSQPLVSLKDLGGYATGLIITTLVWRIHRSFHLGLVQMWRYTSGEGT